MLIGKFKYSIDSKNRICIAHQFRGILGAKCVISKDLLYKCLNLYSMEQWEEYSKLIDKLPPIRMRNTKQFVYSNSDIAEFDSQGRIVLNRDLCEDTGLLSEKEAMIIGVSTHVQIWNVMEWENFSKELNSEKSKATIISDLLESGN